MSSRKQIGNTLTITTMDDPVSIQAQYSPDKVTVHTTWQNGDLYMRTRESDESAWSSWHRIVGESGDETDFSFGISQYKTTANASTAPSDISSWSDAPLAVTTAKPYLWAKVQQKSWNASTQQYQVDSTRYIRLTGEDGYTVEAQYAPNNNPSSSQIHTTWQDGDLYMRTKQSNETTWSSWHRIVGESGDETDYTFNISKSLTSTNATTAPANCYYNTWQDAPIAPTSTYPYLWMKIVKKTWNESTQSYDSGTARYARITGEPGTSPYFADLNNEMDAIQCKHDGSVITDQTVSTVISMWKGSAVEAFVIDNIYRNGTQLTWDGNNNGVWPRVSGSTVSLEFTTSASITDIDDFKITIHSYNDNTVTRELHFTINGVRANAIYRLVPSHSQIVKKKDGTYVPSGNVTCSVEKTENGSTSTPSSSEYTLEKSVNGGSYTTYSATAASSITSDLKFRLKVGGVDVDLETIPLVSDGDKGNTGDSAPYVELSRSTILYQANNDGYSTASQNFPITYALKVNGNTCTISSVNNITISLPTNVTVVSGTKTTSGCTINCTHSVVMSGVITITITGTYNGISYTATGSITVSDSREGPRGEKGEQGERGEQGEQGKIGRFFYYAQVWSNNPNVSYAVTDAEAPYFFYKNPTTGAENYWVFNPEDNGTYTMAQMGEPSNSSSNWEMMHTEFKYIITEAIFGAYAHFGSAIINGDWLISGNGTINGALFKNGEEYNGVVAYTLFDPLFPYGIGNANVGINESVISWNYGSGSDIRAITDQYLLKAGRTYVVKILCHVEIAGLQNEVYPKLLLWCSKDGVINDDARIGETDASKYDADQIFQKTIKPASDGLYDIRAGLETNITYGYGYVEMVVFECQTNTMFVPQYCVDLLSGETSMAGGKVQSNRHGDFTVKGALMYSSLSQDRFILASTDTTTSPHAYTYNLAKGIYEGKTLSPKILANYININGNLNYNNKSSYMIYLPPARLFEGMEITIILNARASNDFDQLVPLTFRVPTDFNTIDPVLEDGTVTVAKTWNRFAVLYNGGGKIFEGMDGGMGGTHLVTNNANVIKLIAAKHPLIEYYHASQNSATQEAYNKKCIAWCVVDAK